MQLSGQTERILKNCFGGSARSSKPIAEGTFWKLPLHGASQDRWKAQ
jgi:hypothetical protein